MRADETFDTRLYEVHIPSPLPTSQSLQIPILLSLTPNASPTSLSKTRNSLSENREIGEGTIKRERKSEKMAQKTEKEETEFKVPETLTLCVNNCGFTGNPATNNMCQKCFNATTATAKATTTATTTATTSAAVDSSTGEIGGGAILKFSSEKASRSRTLNRSTEAAGPIGQSREPDRREEAAVEKRVVNRCSCCRRKVGLTGFRCRCGELFCGEHRYSDRHDCSYDYKSAGRDAIARENPVVKAAKIVRV